MKLTSVAIICLLSLSTGCAFAQSPLLTPLEKNLNEGKVQYEMYKGKYRNGGAKAREILDGVYANGLEPSTDNVVSVRALLASHVTKDEKVALARILGMLHTPDNRTTMNNLIVTDLKSLSRSGEKEIARSAVLALSRLGYFSDSHDLLQQARDKGTLDSDEYFGELAHLVASAPENSQFELVSRIKNGQNK